VATPIADEPSEAYRASSSTVAFRSGRVIDVRTDEVVMADGSRAQRDVVVHPGAVGVIALDQAGRVLLIHQYRHPVRRVLWEPPAGLLDEPGEDPLSAAKRELYEEAHYEAGRWDVLIDAFTSPGMTDEAIRIYLARDVHEADRPRHEGDDEEADMPTSWVPLDEAVEAVFDGRLHNPIAVAGVLAVAEARRTSCSALRPSTSPWPEMSAFPGSAAAADTGA
jgi:ADP-ribose pyrophosphatase